MFGGAPAAGAPAASGLFGAAPAAAAGLLAPRGRPHEGSADQMGTRRSHDSPWHRGEAAGPAMTHLTWGEGGMEGCVGCGGFEGKSTI